MRIPTFIWLLVAAGALYTVQIFPFPGVILMMFAPFVTGLLIDAAMISLFIDAWKGRLPRGLMVFPVLALCLYYATWLAQGWDLKRQNEELRARNPGLALRFDPRRHALIDGGIPVSRYAVPVVYEKRGDSHLAHRLYPRAACEGIRRSDKVDTSFPDWNRDARLCVVRMEESPALAPVTVTRVRSDEGRRTGLGDEIIEVREDGVLRGSFTVAHRNRLSLFPLFVAGCALNSAALSWECMAGFMRSRVVLDGQGVMTLYERDDTRPVAAMLGLRRYTPEELLAWRGYPENAAALSRSREAADLQDRADWESLERLLKGEDAEIPYTANYLMQRNPDRLAPDAQRIASRFGQLLATADPSCFEKKNSRAASGCYSSRNPEFPNRSQQLKLLATALTTLSSAAYRGVADMVFADMQRPGMAWLQSDLWLRSADIGAPGLPHFRAAFLESPPFQKPSVVQVLAICRLGVADPAVIAEMKRRFLMDVPTREYGSQEYREAMVVAMTRVGEKAFIEANRGLVNPQGISASWLDAVLAGTGTTAAGPNNCATSDGEDYPATLAPSLDRRGLPRRQ